MPQIVHYLILTLYGLTGLQIGLALYAAYMGWWGNFFGGLLMAAIQGFSIWLVKELSK